jgi:hypothetical protein
LRFHLVSPRLPENRRYDGSDSGARPDEAISWGKIKTTAAPVKLYAEATLVFPWIVAETFAKDFDKEAWKKENDDTILWMPPLKD